MINVVSDYFSIVSYATYNYLPQNWPNLRNSDHITDLKSVITGNINTELFETFLNTKGDTNQIIPMLYICTVFPMG